MKKVGLLTCSNATQDLECSSYFCLKAIREGLDAFSLYAEDGGTQLEGIISCAGCPTALAPEKIVSRVRSLINSGVETIHFSSCMLAICPFINKYKQVLEQTFLNITFVIGTHGSPDNVEYVKIFRDGVKSMLNQPRATVGDMIKQVREKETGQK